MYPAYGLRACSCLVQLDIPSQPGGMETDAGDFAIGHGHSIPLKSRTPTTTTGPQTPSFAIPPKLEVSPRPYLPHRTHNAHTCRPTHQPFVLLAKSARGAAAANLVGQAIAAQGVYVFSELLATPSIQAVRTRSSPPSYLVMSYGHDPAREPLELILRARSFVTGTQLAKGPHAASYDLLEIFAYGTWADYSGECPARRGHLLHQVRVGD